MYSAVCSVNDVKRVLKLECSYESGGCGTDLTGTAASSRLVCLDYVVLVTDRRGQGNMSVVVSNSAIDVKKESRQSMIAGKVEESGWRCNLHLPDLRTTTIFLPCTFPVSHVRRKSFFPS